MRPRDRRSPTETLLMPTGYELVRHIGIGRMGEVYLARQVSTDQLLAVKFFHPGISCSVDAGLERFLRESALLSEFSHPNIVRIHAHGDGHGRDYMLMEYVQGQTLREKLKDTERVLKAAINSILSQTASALT